MKVVVIGGGPAGIMSAISAKNSGNDVILIEKMNSLGKKLLITGKGRCNITSSLNINEFIQNIPGNGRFLYSAFQNFTNEDIINLLKKHNVKVKEERGNRIFPVSDKSKDVLDAFYEELKNLNVKIYTNSTVNQIIVKDASVTGVEYTFNNNKYTINADKVILATGGKSYPTTGSTGDGYEMAKKLGHTITEIKPSLIPIVANENSAIEKINLENYKNSKELCKSLQGLSLKNVKIQFEDIEKNKVIYDDFGEMLFTHFGISGPTILSSSAHIIRYKNINELLKQGKIILKIDLKPALSNEKLDLRILRDFEKEKNKLFRNSLDELLPQKLIDPVIHLSGINPNKKVNEISKKERMQLLKILKEFCITISGFRPVEEAIITAGGINIKEINPKTMESKLINNLYFAGEIIDVDAYTGGFNLQIAYSTGVTAGLN
ncbi:MAG TPA: NAD(P)/FAD-dependent oxidoreductase [Clostridiaceae bacterium]|jgi:predicted Rossmann fold flavoprotein|nr:NAD(P)/FAD-dependent oxidoreductase [Clostridiaceae bacterium]